MWTDIIQDLKAFGGFPMFVFAIVMAFFLGTRVLFAQLCVGLVFAVGLTAGIRFAYFRPRPKKRRFSTLLGKIDASSFPSLHAMRASVLAVILGVFFTNGWLAALFALLAVAVGMARVMGRQHFLSDVIAGLVLGVLVGFASVFLATLI